MSSSEELLSSAAQGELRHDLRTPFNAILGYVQMILERAEEDGLQPLVPGLTKVASSADQLLSVINNALASDRDVLAEDLVTLGSRICDEVAPLKMQIEQSIALAEDLHDEEAVGDLQKTLQAAGVLLQMGEGRLRSGEEKPGNEQTERKMASAGLGAEISISREPLSGVILAVDDSAPNRDLLCRRLEREGCQAISAASGEQALELLVKQNFDVVLLDLLMPGMDGYEVLCRIKSSAKLRDIPVIMISALDELGSVVRCIEAGAEDYLPKPFDPILLRARVGACLEKKRFRDRELEYLRGVQQLEVAAEAVEKSAFTSEQIQSVTSRDDELGKLARVFERMVTELYARERRLKEEVAQLRIEIDKVRVTQQVGDVTGDDFFRKAQEAGRRSRSKRTDTSS